MSATTSISNVIAGLQEAVIEAQTVEKELQQIGDIARETIETLTRRLENSYTTYLAAQKSALPQRTNYVIQSLCEQYTAHYQAAKKLTEQTPPIESVSELKECLTQLLTQLTTEGRKTEDELRKMQQQFGQCTDAMNRFGSQQELSSCKLNYESCRILLAMLQMTPLPSTSYSSPSQQNPSSGCSLQ